MAVNKYDIKMSNLRKVSSETVNNQRGYSQISYDRSTGELLEAWHVGGPLTIWTECRDPDVVHICNTRKHMTMQRIADAVCDRLMEINSMAAVLSA